MISKYKKIDFKKVKTEGNCDEIFDVKSVEETLVCSKTQTQNMQLPSRSNH